MTASSLMAHVANSNNHPVITKLPDSSMITKDDLPSCDLAEHWIASKKACVVHAVRSGMLSYTEAVRYYRLGPSELCKWGVILDECGEQFLNTRFIRKLPDHIRDRCRLDISEIPLTLSVGEFMLCRDTYTLFANGKAESLPPMVVEFLAIIMANNKKNKGKCVQFETILSFLYPKRAEPQLEILRVFATKIRKKALKISNEELITTIWGRGYACLL